MEISGNAIFKFTRMTFKNGVIYFQLKDERKPIQSWPCCNKMAANLIDLISQ